VAWLPTTLIGMPEGWIRGNADVRGRLAKQLKVDADQICSYGRRAQTRTEHLRLVTQYLGWRAAGALELKSWTSSRWRRPWSTIRRRCCSGWRASIYDILVLREGIG